MTNKKRKKVSIVVTSTLATALALTGTFAWMSISQTATNEAAGLVNTGGRLHDDFNGENKDVYVENFTDPAEGGQEIFVRVRLDEYMETGPDAGKKRNDENRNAIPVITGTSIKDVSKWKTHIPEDTNDTYHDYWTWKTGGKTIYMPTFNKNKDSLETDINGTFAGTDKDPVTDDDRYGDYHTYTDGETKTVNAVYDVDSNNVDEVKLGTAVEGTNIKTVKDEEHTAKPTQEATVLTMREWEDKGSPMGKYWVYDSDGWAYWAEALKPGQTTGLLLDEIKMDKRIPNENWYYAINVVGQFVTADDIGNATDKTGLFGPDTGKAPTDKAMALLKQAATAEIVTGEDSKEYLSYGDNTYKLVNDDGSMGSLICGGADGKPGSTDDQPNVVVLTTLNVTYGSKFLGPQSDNSYLAVGADGKLGTDDDVQVWGNPTLADDIVEECPVDTVMVTAAGNVTSVKAGGNLTFHAEVTGNGQPCANQNVTWTVMGNNSNNTKINNDGVLTVAAEETATSLTIKAISEQKDTVSGTATVNLVKVTSVSVTSANNATIVTKGKMLQYSATVEGNNLTSSDKEVTWALTGNNSTDTVIDTTGLLTVGADETATSLTVKATSTLDASKSGTKSVTVSMTRQEVINAKKNLDAGSTNTVTIDAVEFYVAAKDEENNRALLWTKNVLAEQKKFGESSIWRDSPIRTELNGTWLNDKPTLNTLLVETTIKTRSSYSVKDWIDTQDKVFLLSEADIFETIQFGKAASAEDFTYGTTSFVKGAQKKIGSGYWVRSPGKTADSVAGVFEKYGGLTSSDSTSSNGVRPALWVNLA